MLIITRFTIVILFFLFHFHTIAQFDYFPAGARSMALSNTSVALKDHWATFNNPGALAALDKASLGICTERRFNIKELNSGAITLAIPIKNAGVFGFNFQIFNHSVIYSKQKFGLTYAKRLGKNFFTGIQLDLIRMIIDDYGRNMSICGEVGLLYQLNPRFDIGVHIFNPSASKYRNLEDEKIPTIMRVGLGCKTSDKSLFLLEVGNSSLSKASFKSGLEYNVGKKMVLQLGISSSPVAYSFGIAFLTNKLIINTSMEYHQVLSYTPGLTMDYMFSK